MTQKRSTGTAVGLIMGLVLMMGGCGGESSQTGGTGQVILEPTAAVFAAAKLPGQSATLDIVGVRTGIPMTVNDDGTVTATVPGVPVGTWTFRITYRAGNGSVQYVIAETSMVGTVTANTTTRVKLPPPTKVSAPATAIAAGGNHSCALLADATMSCWGNNDSSQLGNGTTNQSSSPVAVIGLSAPATAIAAGGNHSCAVLNGGPNGTVWCWGANHQGQLGRGEQGTPFESSPALVLKSDGKPLTGATAVAAGDFYSCAVLTTVLPEGASEKTVSCWGGGNSTTAVPVTNLSAPVTAIAAGESNGCAVLNGGPAGTVSCWAAKNPNAVPVLNLTTATDVAAAGNSARFCAVLTGGPGGTVSCWEATNPIPMLVPNLTGVTDVATGVIRRPLAFGGNVNHSCARLTTGAVWCWGDNSFGQLGNGSITNNPTPAPVTRLSGVTAVAAGPGYSCAHLTAGTVWCWGDNDSGQLGDGIDTSSSSPVAVTGLSGVTAVAAGGDHSCAVLNGGPTGTVSCWGDDNPTPVPVRNFDGSALLIGVTAVAAGGNHSCAVLTTVLSNGTTDGTVSCWATNSTNAVPVTGLSGVKGVAAGGRHNCARLTNGSVSCWEGTLSPVPVLKSDGKPLTGATDVAAAGNSTRFCAVINGGPTGTVSCWEGNTLNAVPVPTLTTAIGVAVGSFHTCARLNDGSVNCWGDNSSGQLGNGTDTSPPTPVTPVEVFNLTSATAVAAGSSHSCAVLSSSTLRCWGSNSFGQLGNGTKDQSSIPVAVFNLTTATGVAAGSFHTCARLSGGTVSCWGDNSFGQLGNGALLESTLPVQVVGIP